jgi:sugar-specific transcriptional regulator TrmB
MPDKRFSKLQRLGLSSSEAEIYLALLRNGGTLGATSLADAMGVQRTAVYPVLTALARKGFVAAGAGYGSSFTAVRPDEAFPSFIAREREERSERERVAAEELRRRECLATELARELKYVAEPSGFNGASELVQVLRDPRAVKERVGRLQREARRQIDVFTKPPYFGRGNPGEKKSLRRGLRVRSLYERSALDDPRVKPHLSKWIAAGEEARVIDGELPHKLAIFDNEIVVMPLPVPGDQMRTLVIRHTQLAKSLGLAFQFLWEQAEPIATTGRKKLRRSQDRQTNKHRTTGKEKE